MWKYTWKCTFKKKHLFLNAEWEGIVDGSPGFLVEI